MNKLYELGINEYDIKNMIELCPDIKKLSDYEINNKIIILKSLKCEENDIRNIIISNPEYLLRFDSDVKELINKLISLGIKTLNMTIDSNPWLLTKTAFEIDDYIKEKQKCGLEIDDIIDLIDSGMME